MEQTHNINTLGTRFSRQALGDGMRDGVPIGLGYFAVSFSLGIAAKNAGLTPFQGFLASLLCNASAGEYAGFTMSQRLDPAMPGFHRPLMAFHITDELFGIAIARPGCLNPFYSYGAVLVAAPCWAVGTALGAIAGGLLPLRLVSAFSVALYGMFLAVIIPAARQSKVIAGLIVLCFGASYGAAHLPAVSQVSGGTRTIILTVVLSAAAALLFPQNTEEDETNA